MVRKTLVLFFNNTENENIMLDILNTYDDVDACCVMKKCPKLLRMIRRIHIKVTSKGLGIWLLKWKKQLDKYNMVICIASVYSGSILKWIKRKNPELKLINYFWDNLKISKYPLEKCWQYDNWSFCYEDCKKYNLKYNPQFWIRKQQLERCEKKYELSYVGADRNGTLKGRNECVKELINFCETNNILNYIYYVTEFEGIPLTYRHSKLISERKYNEIVSQSKCIVEFVEEDQRWITLRTFFALSNGIKLITNNTDICKEPFYNKNNIFIINKNWNELNDFINLPFDSDVNINYYEFSNWIKRFEERRATNE